MRETSVKTRSSSSSRTPVAARAISSGSVNGEVKSPRSRGSKRKWHGALAARLRAAAGQCSLREVADRTRANSETVRRYMRDGNPNAKFLARFCQEFSVSADWLLGVAANPPSGQPDRRSAASTAKEGLPLPELKSQAAARTVEPEGPTAARATAKSRRTLVRTAGAPLPPSVAPASTADPGPAGAGSAAESQDSPGPTP